MTMFDSHSYCNLHKDVITAIDGQKKRVDALEKHMYKIEAILTALLLVTGYGVL